MTRTLRKFTKEEEKLIKEASEAVNKNPELKPLIAFLHGQAELLNSRFIKIEEKQTEFETTFKNIMKRLLDLEGRRDQAKKG